MRKGSNPNPPGNKPPAPPNPPPATGANGRAPARHQLGQQFSDPDLVAGIFDYVVKLLPEIAARRAEVEAAVRDEFAGIETYVRKRAPGDRGPELAARVLAMFNGRNASEVARVLRISRATVYRLLKQAGGKLSQFSEK